MITKPLHDFIKYDEAGVDCLVGAKPEPFGVVPNHI
jgi:hypothetical protein